MPRRIIGWVALPVICVLIVLGCSRTPEAQKARHLERGDKYVARKQYREAILEYRNVLRLDPANTRASKELGLAHYHLGEMAQAYRNLLRAEELAPDDLDVRVKLATIYFFGGKPDEARREVNLVLEKDPKNLDALT